MIRTLSDKATLMGLEFGALDRMGMNQDPPPLTHTQSTGLRCSVTEKKKKEKKKEREKKKKWQGCNTRSLRKRAHRAETLLERNLGRFFSACWGNCFF